MRSPIRTRSPRHPRRPPAWRGLVALGLVALAATSPTLSAEEDTTIQVAVRCDDVGMCHAGNMAIRRLLETGIPFSASMMVACPWFPEAAEILRDQTHVSLGIHLMLNSEWEHYKWGPVLGRTAVPSLVDEHGYFHTSEAEFAEAGYDLGEVELELRAQIERALGAGLKIDYLDYHMGTAVSTPELQEIVERLAAEYGFGLSRYFRERSASLWDVAPQEKLTRLLELLGDVQPGRPNLIVIHLGMETPEMKALVDANNPADPFRVAQHRQAELDALSSPAFRSALAARGIELVTYRDLIDRHGTESMTAPAERGYSMGDIEE